jgi:hypothetical protein
MPGQLLKATPAVREGFRFPAKLRKSFHCRAGLMTAVRRRSLARSATRREQIPVISGPWVRQPEMQIKTGCGWSGLAIEGPLMP